jgi:coenzyme PQQ precursor peptide PqqA
VQNNIWEIVMEINNTWATPVACEVCVGMEVTSYMSAEI